MAVLFPESLEVRLFLVNVAGLAKAVVFAHHGNVDRTITLYPRPNTAGQSEAVAGDFFFCPALLNYNRKVGGYP